MIRLIWIECVPWQIQLDCLYPASPCKASSTVNISSVFRSNLLSTYNLSALYLRKKHRKVNKQTQLLLLSDAKYISEAPRNAVTIYKLYFVLLNTDFPSERSWCSELFVLNGNIIWIYKVKLSCSVYFP